MDVNAIIDNARTLSYTNSNQLSNTNAIPLLNFIYNDITAEIREMNENYFYFTDFINTVAFQNGYNFTLPTSWVSAIQKLLQVSILFKLPDLDTFTANYAYNKGDKIQEAGLQYRAKADFTSWLAFNLSDWAQVREWYGYVNEQNIGGYDLDMLNNRTDPLNTSFPFNVRQYTQQNPIYIFGNSKSNDNQQALYVYPYPEYSVTQWIKIEGIRSIIDLVVWGAESTILIDRQYHRALSYGLSYLIFQSQWKENEAISRKWDYDREKDLVLRQMSNRTLSPNYQRMPNLYNLS